MGISNRWIHCAECGRNRQHKAKGLCGQCYDRQWSVGYRKAHKERKAAYDRQRYWANPEKARENKRRRDKANAKYISEYGRQWRKDNPDKNREKSRIRRARKNGATIGPVDEAAIYERDGACIYCGSDKDLTLDHLTPLSRGGPHTQDNLAVACRSCNSSKGTKPLEDWLQTQPRALAWVA